LAVDSTRIRYISARTVEEVTQAVTSLPFRVELKSLVYNPEDKRFYQTFVVPDNVETFNNVEL
jgi:hypothetical protein